MSIQEIILRISQMRTEANLSARELSGRIGKSGSYINALEAQKGGFEPSLSALLDMELLQHFKKLTPEQKAAILTLVEKFLA